MVWPAARDPFVSWLVCFVFSIMCVQLRLAVCTLGFNSFLKAWAAHLSVLIKKKEEGPPYTSIGHVLGEHVTFATSCHVPLSTVSDLESPPSDSVYGRGSAITVSPPHLIANPPSIPHHLTSKFL
jgi:hypothetical protein